MKIRNGFVSNSSSSSFILVYKKFIDAKDFKDLYANDPTNEAFENFSISGYDEDYEEVICSLDADEKKEFLNDMNNYEFDGVMVDLRIDPSKITPDIVDYNISSAVSTDYGGIRFFDCLEDIKRYLRK